MSPTRTTISVEEARRVLDEAEAARDPYAPRQSEIDRFKGRLWADNGEASPEEIDAALRDWIAEQTEERRAAAEIAAADAERHRRQSLCRGCGETAGQRRVLYGPESLREGLLHGAGTAVCLCRSCYEATRHALGRAVYEASPERYDALAKKVLDGDTQGLAGPGVFA